MRFSAPPVLETTIRRGVFLAYDLDPDRVASSLPRGLAADTREGRAHVLVVAAELTNVFPFGLSGFGIDRMPVVEFCCPVQESSSSLDRNGTLSLQTVVPRRRLAWGARVLTGTPIDAVSMPPVHAAGDEATELTVRFDWKGREQRIRTVSGEPREHAPAGRLSGFLLRRNWRYGTRRASVVRTRIDGSFGSIRPLEEQNVTVDWGDVVGEVLRPLHDRPPASGWSIRGRSLTVGWPASLE